jgi:Smr domain
MRKRKPPPGQGVSREAWGRVHPQLDLHGMTGEEARRRTEQWLRDRQAEGVRTVVVVTGRGLHSLGIPVVRNEVEHLLAGLKGTLVARWESAAAGGSFRVELRRPPPDSAPRVAPPPLLSRADPALRRRAEEALWELGIDPTPPLLEAEIRRILNEDAPGDE